MHRSNINFGKKIFQVNETLAESNARVSTITELHVPMDSTQFANSDENGYVFDGVKVEVTY